MGKQDQRGPRIKQLFLDALEVPPEQRRAFLRERIDDADVRRQVQRLLELDGSENAPLLDLQDPLEQLMAGAVGAVGGDGGPARQESTLPERIGPYRILKKLGEGGMGIVYEAEQERPRRRVALKLIRAGVDSDEIRRRFQRESDVLARLHHPGIAQVYEAGTAETALGVQPFFAMELVEGRPLLEYAAKEKLGVPEKLELLEKLCAAVEHSHQQSVVHRDLKPANIIVGSSGEPKILDFGVARVIQSGVEAESIETQIGQLVGTLPFMSPEQISGNPLDIDTRTDIYALGVVGFELLSGTLPYDLQEASLPRAVQILSTAEPRRLGAVDGSLRGDIEAILGKALERDKTRRYSSAAEFGEDLRRVARDEPVSARPQTTVYVLTKFARRNRLLVGSALAIVVALALLTAISFTQARIATRERDLARQRLDQSQTFSDLIHRTLESVSPDRDGRDVRVIDMFRRLVPAMKESLEDEPVARAAISDTLGLAFFRLGAYDDSETLLRSARELRSKLEESEHGIEQAETMQHLGMVLTRKGELAEAESLLRTAEALRRRIFGPSHAAVAESLDELGVLFFRGKRDLKQGREYFQTALDMRRELPGENGQAVARSLRHLAEVAEFSGHYDEAQRRLEEALEISRRVLSEDHPDLAATLVELADLLQDRGRLVEAEPLFEQAIALQRRLLGPRHPDLSLALVQLARFYVDRRDFERARVALDEALAICKETYGEEHADVAEILGVYFDLYYEKGEIDPAEGYARRSLETVRRIFGEHHPEYAEKLRKLAICEQWKGNDAAATDLLQTAVAIFREHLDEDAHRLGLSSCLVALGMFATRRGDYEESEPALREALEIRRSVIGPEHPQTAHTEYELANVLLQTERQAEALPLLEHVRAVNTRVYGEGDLRNTFVLFSLARIRESTGDPAVALPLFEESRRRFSKMYDDDHWLIHVTNAAIGDCLRQLGKPEEAEPLLVSAYERLRERLTPTNPKTLDPLRSLIALYRETGRPEEAARYEALLPPPTDQ